MTKLYLSVLAEFTQEGRILPRVILWPNGRRFPVERILSIRRAASMKAGGPGVRYVCRISGQERTLFLEERVRWFVHPHSESPEQNA